MSKCITLAAGLIVRAGAAAAQAPVVMPPGLQPGQTRASQLIDEDVYDARNEEIGEIEDLIIDVGTGTVVGAVIEIEGSVGVPQRYISVPLSRMQIGRDNRITITATADEIKAMANYEFQRRQR